MSLLALVFGTEQSKAAGNVVLTISLSSANGGNSTGVSWSFNTFLTATGASAGTDPSIAGFTLNTTGLYSLNPSTNISISGAGFLTNTTASSSQEISQISLSQNAGTDTFALDLAAPLTITSGNRLIYIPGTDSYVIPVAFSSFNTGTYSTTNNTHNQFNFPEIISLSVASVPEPSTSALFGLGAIGLLTMLLKRKMA